MGGQAEDLHSPHNPVSRETHTRMKAPESYDNQTSGAANKTKEYKPFTKDSN